MPGVPTYASIECLPPDNGPTTGRPTPLGKGEPAATSRSRKTGVVSGAGAHALLAAMDAVEARDRTAAHRLTHDGAVSPSILNRAQATTRNAALRPLARTSRA